ncbi:putative wall-associated receptor kinase-like 16 [Panicum miliaceum]|uniref:Wall-associated receptor kinase-like 16 n=1 Tax=Panicum miliaceum TaxID=4540 RepID=A0A3L6PKU2_PANMI|nr:putative wall-associated receptor kinase-like 16 [Panicum miliaceum]
MGLRPNCSTTCGGVSVPYPFGIDPGCHLGESFRLTCNTSLKPPLLLLRESFQVMNISLDDSTVRLTVFIPIITSPMSILGLIFGYQLQEWSVSSTSAVPGPNERRPGNETCPYDLGTAACHSRHSTCQGLNIGGYICKCDEGYQGNPYLSDGCQDIDECSLPGKCFSNCTNLPGGYWCLCPEGTIGDPYTRDGCVKPRDPNKGLTIGLGVGSGAMLLFLALSITFTIYRILTRKKRMRRRCFDQNHGQLLQQLVYQRADISERMILTLDELEKATNNFDKARELGGGGHGTVYKGILSNLHVVAIKKSKIVIQREIDEFINEVVILSQINHRNVVKLYGCCLEAEVPLLVYEFISNGTLYNHLHVEGLLSLPWKDRVRIAVETARALAYLHSLASMPIIHRDIKSPNILLDDNLTVKLSDFGASRYIPVDQTGLDTAVQGTFGYLDPTYHSTGHLTNKSDVYSFEDNLVRILDPQIVKEAGGEVIDIALLAAMCVKSVSKERPTMRQVEMTLESIHAAKEYYASSDITEESEENYVRVNDMSIIGGTNEDTLQASIDY